MATNNRVDDSVFKTSVMGIVKRSRQDTEMIVFTIKLGYLHVICIVNIPDEGVNEAPVYVKYKFVESTPR